MTLKGSRRTLVVALGAGYLLVLMLANGGFRIPPSRDLRPLPEVGVPRPIEIPTALLPGTK